MRKWILAAALVAASTATQAQYGSNPNSYGNSGYTTQRGTYVQPYRATSPNSTDRDNYSTRGNVNPYTGAVGTRAPRNPYGW